MCLTIYQSSKDRLINPHARVARLLEFWFSLKLSDAVYVEIKYDGNLRSSFQINRKSNFVIIYLEAEDNKMVQNFFLFMLAINIIENSMLSGGGPNARSASSY